MLNGELNFESFESGVDDAKSDLAGGWVMAGGPTETGVVDLDYIVNELRFAVGCTDEYLAGYLSVIFGK